MQSLAKICVGTIALVILAPVEIMYSALNGRPEATVLETQRLDACLPLPP